MKGTPNHGFCRFWLLSYLLLLTALINFNFGQVEFKCILFIPGEANGLYEDYNNRKAGMKLYVRKVLIQDDFEDLLPR